MKKVTLSTAAIFAYCILITANCFSQGTAINNSGAAADNSAMLDVSSTSQGVLMPRLTQAQKSLITAPANGLLIYQTDGVKGFYYNTGSGVANWIYLGSDNLGNHTATDSLNMSMKKIYNLATCTNNLDAANKLYVDGKVGAGSGGSGSFNSCTGCVAAISTIEYNSVNWAACRENCRNLTEGGFTDWRMPTVEDALYYASGAFNPPDGTWLANNIWTSTMWDSKITQSAATYRWATFGELDGGWVDGGYTSIFDCRCVR